MVRPSTIDRERLLDIAESIISEAGAVTISFGGLAEAAGLSKASVQSVFGTREAMMEALLERWLRKEQRAYQKKIGPQSSLRERVRRHVKITGKESSEANSRLAAVLTALVGSDATEGVMAKWYASRVGKFSAETQEERLLRIAFLAAEGAFFMRHVAGFPMSDRLWRELFHDLLDFVAEPVGGAARSAA